MMFRSPLNNCSSIPTAEATSAIVTTLGRVRKRESASPVSASRKRSRTAFAGMLETIKYSWGISLLLSESVVEDRPELLALTELLDPPLVQVLCELLSACIRHHHEDPRKFRFKRRLIEFLTRH